MEGVYDARAFALHDVPLLTFDGMKCRASLNHVPPVRMERPTIQDAAQIQNTMNVSTVMRGR